MWAASNRELAHISYGYFLGLNHCIELEDTEISEKWYEVGRLIFISDPKMLWGAC